jgi:hypothetical protein
VTNYGAMGKKRNLIRENSENGEESKAKVVIKSFKGTSWRKSGMAGNNLVCIVNNFSLMCSQKDFHSNYQLNISTTELYVMFCLEL